jgi:c-di-GMP-binding flagellar brake protein YcgR
MVLHTLKEAINRRRHVRRASDATAVIHFDGGKDIRCNLLDISAGGARLRLETPSDLPPSFMLTVPAEQIEHRCTLVWKNGERVGVLFG